MAASKARSQAARKAAAKKAAETRKLEKQRREKVAAIRKRRQAALKGWEKRRSRNPQAGRMAALKGWRTRRSSPEAIERRKEIEIERLKRELEISEHRRREAERRVFVLENPLDIKSEHAEFLTTNFKGTKGYGLTMSIEQIYLEYDEIYDNIHELYELYMGE